MEQRLGSQRVDSLGDTALRLRQAGDIGEHERVALPRLKDRALRRYARATQ